MAFCKKFSLLLLLAILTFLTTSCGDTVGHITTIRIFPMSTTVSVDSNTTFKATGYDSEGDAIAIEPTWSVNGDIGSINAAGIFTATKAGIGNVMAYYAGITTYAQVIVTTQGGISGRVTNSQGERLSGILVSLDSPSIDTTTSSNGSYLFSSLSAGKYLVAVNETIKYLSASQEVSVISGITATANFTLVERIGVFSEAINQAGQSITVTGSLINNGSTKATTCTVNYIFYDIDGFAVGSGNASVGDLDSQQSKSFSVFISLSEDSYSNYDKITACGGY